MDYTAKSTDHIGSSVYTWDALTTPINGRNGKRNRFGHAFRRMAGTVTGKTSQCRDCRSACTSLSSESALQWDRIESVRVLTVSACPRQAGRPAV